MNTSRQIARTAALIALAGQLGACSSFLGIHFARHSDRPPEAVQLAASEPAVAPPVAVAADPAESALQAGRAYLAANQTGLAIEQFQIVLASSTHIAPALNGLGVAYARLGRYDAARRFFEEAVAADPADERFAVNLARLYRSGMIAQREMTPEPVIAPPEQEPPQAVAEARPGKLERVASREFHIRSVEPGDAPLRSAALSVDPRFKPLVRIEFGKPSGNAASPVVKVITDPAREVQKP